MRCDPPLRRDARGWAALAGIALLLAFYAVVFRAMMSPTVDEDYRRTFITQEFGAYPPSKVFEGRNGLDYVPGSRVGFDTDEKRLLLARFDWLWLDPPAPNLKAFEGRLFLHLPDDARDPGRPWRLRLGFLCDLPPDLGTIVTVSVNGAVVGTTPCSSATREVTFDQPVPAGILGTARYDEITIRRDPATLAERIRTRIGLRSRALGLEWMELSPG